MLQSESDGAFVVNHRSNELFTGWPHCSIGSSLGGSILMIVCPSIGEQSRTGWRRDEMASLNNSIF
jgi:hypothetical protein